MELLVRILILIFVSMFISGCAIFVEDVSSSAEFGALTGRRMLTTGDALLFEGVCFDVDSKIQSTTHCPSLQYFGLKDMPATYGEYLNDRSGWDARLFHRLMFDKQRTAIGLLPKGTELRLTRVVDTPWGDYGRFLIVRAEVVTGQFAGYIVELPTHPFIHKKPLWANDDGVYTRKLEFNNEYLLGK